MGAREVAGPDGRVWKVGRRWFRETPGWRRRADRDSDASAFGDLLGFDEPAGIVVGLAVAILLILLLTVGWPLVVIAAEIVFVVLAAMVALAGRVLFRRPWTVRAVADGVPPVEWQVSGWRASGELIEKVVTAISSGADVRQISAG